MQSKLLISVNALDDGTSQPCRRMCARSWRILNTSGSATMAKDNAGRRESTAARQPQGAASDRSNNPSRTKQQDCWLRDALEDDEVRQALKLAPRPKSD